MNQKKSLAVLLALLLVFSVFFCTFGDADDFLMGDADFNGKITSADARVALRISARLYTDYTQDCFTACDVNGDKRVSSADGRLILAVAARIYDPSYFVDPFTTRYIDGLITSETRMTERTDVNWDDILGTTATTTSRPTTTALPTRHPNNFYTTATPPSTQPPKTEPSGSSPAVTEVPGTVPQEPGTTGTTPSQPGTSGSTAPQRPSGPTTTAPPVVHTDVRPRPPQTTDPPPPTTAPTTVPPTEAPDLPLFSAEPTVSSDTVRIALYVEKAKGLKAGSLSCSFDPDRLSFVSFEPNTSLGLVDFRETGAGELSSEFVLDGAAGDGRICFGVLVFSPTTGSTDTALTLSVKGNRPSNWRDGKGGHLSPLPNDLSFRVTAQ